MFFDQPSLLVRYARTNVVEVREADVNFSDWDCTLEPVADGRHAVRLGFRQIRGLNKKELEKLTAARGNGYASIERLAAVGVSRSTIERLAEADAFRSLGLDRRAALWAARRLDAIGVRSGGRKNNDAEENPPTKAAISAGAPLPLLLPHMSDELFPEPQVELLPMQL